MISKRMKVRNLLQLSLAISLVVFASAWRFSHGEKSKVINKTFELDQDDRVEIHNSFGQVHVSSWDNPNMEVEVEIMVSSRYDDRMEDMLEGIQIDFDDRSDGISMRSEVDLNTKNNEEFEINFTVKMPRSNPLDLKNSFGDVYLDDRSGEVDIKLNYGDLKAGNLTKGGQLQLSFGKGDVKSFGQGQIELKYSDYFSLDESRELELDQQYSQVEIGKVNVIDMRSRYGQADFGEVGKMELNVHFTDFTIELLNGSLDMLAKYASNFSLDKVSKDFNFIDIEGNYGNYHIDLEEGLQADFKAEFKFASMRVLGVDIDYSLRLEENGKESYEARIGGGHENKRIRITSTYGDLRMTQ